ncbi:hypothetical protein VNO80_03221 [Phaseolus coccineus]|uniref:Uncharacterized protein n=1 Tax=Phaseolus coccineus TaxID=3886 RepID=A0AAN9NQX1_PHACN
MKKNPSREIVLEALKLNEPCSHPNCTFGGIWDGGKGNAKPSYLLLSEERVPFVCMDIAYQYRLLVDGFGLDPLQEITVAKEIEYEDFIVEITASCHSHRSYIITA